MTILITTLTADVFLQLYRAAGWEPPFYERHGFEQRPCAWDGPGMFKMLR